MTDTKTQTTDKTTAYAYADVIIIMKKKSLESFEDARDRAEDICLEKRLPVKFCYAGFWYTIDKGTSDDV